MSPVLSFSRWGRASYETEQSVAYEKSLLKPLINLYEDNSDAELIVVHSKLQVNGQFLQKVPSARLILTTTSGYEHLQPPY